MMKLFAARAREESAGYDGQFAGCRRRVCFRPVNSGAGAGLGMAKVAGLTGCFHWLHFSVGFLSTLSLLRFALYPVFRRTGLGMLSIAYFFRDRRL